MNIKNIVKVMNFHSLLRVDKAKKEAEKYFVLETELRKMIDSITNNRNFVLDKRKLNADENAPVLNIYVGSDLGFCGGYNFVVNENARRDKESHKILIGKKLWSDMKDVKLHMTKAEYDENPEVVEKHIDKSIQEKRYSQINIFYNNYIDAGNIQWIGKRIFPFEFSEDTQEKYSEDFFCETDLNRLLVSMVSAYINFEIMITVINSYASENVMRQNSTSESLKKIDEIEEEKLLEQRKAKSEKEFQKVIENYSKVNRSGRR